jgi:hypothetical protein
VGSNEEEEKENGYEFNVLSLNKLPKKFFSFIECLLCLH